jgi:hypothetical protein
LLHLVVHFCDQVEQRRLGRRQDAIDLGLVGDRTTSAAPPETDRGAGRAQPTEARLAQPQIEAEMSFDGQFKESEEPP